MNYGNKDLKPIIGVTTLYDKQKNSMWMLPGYLDGIRLAGGVPLIIPLDLGEEDLERIYAVCNGFLLTGGQDIHPSLYGETDSGLCLEVSEKRDKLDSWIFKRAYHDNKAILGICRGFQLINALLGGSLYQNLPSQLSGFSSVSHTMSPPYQRAHHMIDVVKESFLYKLLNSCLFFYVTVKNSTDTLTLIHGLPCCTSKGMEEEKAIWVRFKHIFRMPLNTNNKTLGSAFHCFN